MDGLYRNDERLIRRRLGLTGLRTHHGQSVGVRAYGANKARRWTIL